MNTVSYDTDDSPAKRRNVSTDSSDPMSSLEDISKELDKLVGETDLRAIKIASDVISTYAPSIYHTVSIDPGDKKCVAKFKEDTFSLSAKIVKIFDATTIIDYDSYTVYKGNLFIVVINASTEKIIRTVRAREVMFTQFRHLFVSDLISKVE